MFQSPSMGLRYSYAADEAAANAAADGFNPHQWGLGILTQNIKELVDALKEVSIPINGA